MVEGLARVTGRAATPDQFELAAQLDMARAWARRRPPMSAAGVLP